MQVTQEMQVWELVFDYLLQPDARVLVQISDDDAGCMFQRISTPLTAQGYLPQSYTYSENFDVSPPSHTVVRCAHP